MRLTRRTLANLASFYTQQQSLAALASLVDIDEENAAKVRRIYERYASANSTKWVVCCTVLHRCCFLALAADVE